MGTPDTGKDGERVVRRIHATLHPVDSRGLAADARQYVRTESLDPAALVPAEELFLLVICAIFGRPPTYDESLIQGVDNPVAATPFVRAASR